MEKRKVMKKSQLENLIREILEETIRKVDGKYAVYPKKGGKRLGTHSTRKAAEKQLTAIHLNEKTVEIKYIQPNFEEEWEEANRYDEFIEMGKVGWLKIAKQGYVTHFSKIENVLGNVDLNFDELEEPKKKRFHAAYKKGTIEMPIAVKFADGDYDLVAGNTRLAGLVMNNIDPKIWIVDISYLVENFIDKKVKGKSRPGRVKKAGASCKGTVAELRAKAKKYGGEKGKMYHWCANMKSGKK